MRWLDVDAMLDSISAEQFDEWYESYQIDHFGDRWAELQNAQLCALIANIHLPKNAPRAKLSDFMFFPDEKDIDRVPDEESMKLVCQKITTLVSNQIDNGTAPPEGTP